MSLARYMLLIPLAVLILLASAPPVQAQDGNTIIVHANCSLADAIRSANDNKRHSNCAAGTGDDTIVVTGTITLTNWLPSITSNITISGGDISGNNSNSYRVFTVTSGHLTLNGVTVRNGRIEDYHGGGIYVGGSGSLTVNNSVIRDNFVRSGHTSFGGIDTEYEKGGGGIFHTSSGSVTITDSVIANNGATGYGGGLRTASSASGHVTIIRSKFINNSTQNTYGVQDVFGNRKIISSPREGGAVFTWSSGGMTIRQSAFHGNAASGSGNSIYVAGGSLGLFNSTVAGNSDASHSVQVNGGSIDIRNSTITANAYGFAKSGGSALITNSIISGNSSADCTGSGITGHDNHIGRGCAGIATSAGNAWLEEVNADASAYGTTMAQYRHYVLQPRSPAIGTGNANQCTYIHVGHVDQLGTARPNPAGSRCDKGAVESARSETYTGPSGTTINISETSTYGRSFTASGTSYLGAEPTYTWYLAILPAATGPTFSHSFSGGKYIVSLVVTDEYGLTERVSKSFRVGVAVSADFSWSISNNLQVAFDSSASVGEGGVTCAWQIGSYRSTDCNPYVQFGTPGERSVSLTVTSVTFTGESATVTKAVTWIETKADFSFTTDDLAVTFDSSASGGAGSLSYSWNFGNSMTSTDANPTHTYAAAGTYTVQLTVTDDNNVTATATKSVTVTAPPVADFSFDTNFLQVTFDSSGSSGTGSLSYSWDFGDSSAASTAASPTHTYAAAGTYDVELTVTDGSNASVSVTKSVTVTAAPVADFSFTADGLAVTFDSSASSGTGSLSYSWDFGDTNTSTTASPTHTYAAAGDYSVKLTVTDGNSVQASKTKTVTVSLTVSADFSFSADGLTVTFDSSASTGSSLTYSWEFGDTNTSTAAGPTHTYATAGDYSVKLTVTDGSSVQANITKTVTVSVELVSAFSFTANGLEVSFTASVTTASNLSYSWDFGDNSGTSTDASPTYTYASYGEYTVTVTVSNAGGSDEAEQTITLAPPTAPTAQFSYSLNGLTAIFNSSGSTGSNLEYAWCFSAREGGADCSAANAESTEASPSHEYPACGSYTATLILSNDGGESQYSASVDLDCDLQIMLVVQRVRQQPTKRPNRRPDPTPTPTPTKAPVHTCVDLTTGTAEGITVWTQHGLTSGIQCQRRELHVVHVIQAPNIEAVINAGIQDVIEIWGFTGQTWEICFDNWRLGPNGGLMFIEKVPPLDQVVHTSPGVYDKGLQTCLKLHDKAGYVVEVAWAPAPSAPQPTPPPNYRSLGADCMVRTNYILNLRDTPGGAVRMHIPFNVTLTAFERAGDWIKVDYHGERGWLSAPHLTEVGYCG